MGNSVTIDGYHYSGSKTITATITPHQLGFKILFQPVTSHFVCALSNYVTQSGTQKTLKVTDNYQTYNLYKNYYHGYVDSGAMDACATYSVDTTWIIFLEDLSFDPKSSYSVTLDDVTSDGFSAQTVTVTPSQ